MCIPALKLRICMAVSSPQDAALPSKDIIDEIFAGLGSESRLAGIRA